MLVKRREIERELGWKLKKIFKKSSHEKGIGEIKKKI